LQRPPTEREVVANEIAKRLDKPIAVLGVCAFGLWLAEPLTESQELLDSLLDIAVLIILVAFVVEFVARTVVAPETWVFLRRHWWEVILVVLPFLRFLRVLRAARAGTGLASAVQTSRGAGHRLGQRVFVLAIITGFVICGTARLLWDYGGKGSYADQFHDSAMATLTGSSLGSSDPFPQMMDVVLAAYSVVIIAVLAGAVGAFFLRRPQKRDDETAWWEGEADADAARPIVRPSS
jgi:voltage-gated potassium channel